MQTLYAIQTSVPTQRFGGAEARGCLFCLGQLSCSGAALSSCDREHMAHKAYHIYLLALYRKASLQSSDLGEHTQMPVGYNSKRRLLKFQKFHRSSEEGKITPPQGQEGRLPGGSGQDVGVGRMERCSPGLRALRCPLSPCTPPALPTASVPPSSCTSRQRRELGKGLCGVTAYFSKLMSLT